LTDRTRLSKLTFALARTVQTQYIPYRQTATDERTIASPCFG